MEIIILTILLYWVIASLKDYVCTQTVCREEGATQANIIYPITYDFGSQDSS